MYISKIKILFLLLGLNISVVGFAAGQSNVTFSRDKKGFTLCNGYVYLKFDSDSCTINQLKFDKTGEANYGPNIAFCQEDGLAGVCVELSTPDGECKLSRGKEFKIITEKLSPEEASIIIKNLQTMNPSGNVLTTENWQLILEKGAKEFAILRNEKYLRETIVNWDRLSLLVDERVACVKKSNVQCPMSMVNQFFALLGRKHSKTTPVSYLVSLLKKARVPLPMVIQNIPRYFWTSPGRILLKLAIS